MTLLRPPRLAAHACTMLLVLLLHCPGVTWADDEGPGGDELLAEGIRLYTAADFVKARQTLTQAKGRLTDPVLLARVHLYLGCIHFEQGRRSQAGDEFRRALQQDPSLAPDPEAFKPPLVQLFRTVRAGLEGWVSVRTSPPGVSVHVDGELLGETPLERASVSVGTHLLSLSGPGLAKVYRTIVVAHDRLLALDVTLEPLGKAEARARQQMGFEEKRHQRRLMTWLGNSGLGLGAACLLTMSILYGVGHHRGTDAHEHYLIAEDPLVIEHERARVQEAERLITGGHVMLVLSAVSFSFAAVSYLARPDLPEGGDIRSLTLDVQAGHGAAGVRLTGRF